MKPFTESMLNQCRKYMFNFFDYLPTKYQASARDWQVRKFVWAFKDGKCTVSAAQLVAKKIREQFGTSASDMVFVCIPASSQRKNEIRYREFSEEVARLSGAVNGYSHITVEGERLATHESKSGKHVNDVQVINFDKEFFKDKKVLVFDDVITRGYSYARFACHLESFGASVIGGMFLAKTLFV